MMRFGDFLQPGHIVADLRACTKDEAIQELVDALVLSGDLPLPDREPAILALLKREALAPTGIGRGIAIPHAQIRSLRALTTAIGVSRVGIPFSGDDMAHVIFLLLSPNSNPPEHLEMMGVISRLANDPRTLALIRNATSTTKIFHAVREAENRIFPPSSAF